MPLFFVTVARKERRRLDEEAADGCLEESAEVNLTAPYFSHVRWLRMLSSGSSKPV